MGKLLTASNFHLAAFVLSRCMVASVALMCFAAVLAWHDLLFTVILPELADVSELAATSGRTVADAL